MAKKQPRISAKWQPWIDARRKFRLSDAHVQMARELGMNPKKLGKLDNHDQEPWKLPLPEFIAKLYSKRFGKERPDPVRSIEAMAAAKQTKRRAKKTARDGALVDQRDARPTPCTAVSRVRCAPNEQKSVAPSGASELAQ